MANKIQNIIPYIAQFTVKHFSCTIITTGQLFEFMIPYNVIPT